MRQWRVGSFSMGLLLVLLGVGLIVDRARGSAASLQLVIDWWPVILILLGGEVLAVGFFSRNEQIRIKYDVWSILLVVTFFFFSLGSYALTYSGVLPRLQEAIASREHSVSLPEQVITLEGVEKVVLSYSDGEVELRSSSADSIHIFGEASVFAVNEEDAARLAEMGKADYHRAGDTLFIQIKQLPSGHDIFRPGSRNVSRTILVPGNVALEVRGSTRYFGTLHLAIDSLAAPWSLDVNGSVKATLGYGLDVTISGYSGRPGDLGGSAAWVIETEDNGETTGTGASGTIILGEGRWPLYLSSSCSIEVNIR